jgi:tetratricopeptide (TPR) repeat protein
MLVVALLAGGGLYYRSHRSKRLTDKDTIVLADFANSTGDPVFDDTLKTALNVSLRQSPFLNVLPESQFAQTLKLMERSGGEKLTPDVTRELCQRVGSKAYVAGSIATLGSQYVLDLKAVNCHSGDTLAEEQTTAASKEKVLDALGQAASKLRGELGESLASVQKYDVPLIQATTSSMEALKEFSNGYRPKVPIPEQISYDERAIELDPNFAMAYADVGNSYDQLGEVGRAREYYTKAFQLREHASEREKLDITAAYYQHVTGELEKAVQAYQRYLESYPDPLGPAYLSLGNLYAQQGEYEKAAEVTRQNMRLAPDAPGPYVNLVNDCMALQRFDEARQIIHQAQTRNIDPLYLHESLYALAFFRADQAGMDEEQKRLASRADTENFGLELASDTEAYGGHVRKARELTGQAVDSAIRADDKENGAIWQAIAAQREAAYGNAREARQLAAAALKLAPASEGVESEAALAFALAGDAARAESVTQDLGKTFPLDTQMQSIWLPAVRAQLAIERRNASAAVQPLQTLPRIEFGQIMFVLNISCLYPAYVRGEAYLAAGQGSAAAAEFQKILDHSGLVWNCWTGALAHLGVARAEALEARTLQGADADAARSRALAAYKNFLTLWKDADPEIPILKQAKAEYAKMR